MDTETQVQIQDLNSVVVSISQAKWNENSLIQDCIQIAVSIS